MIHTSLPALLHARIVRSPTRRRLACQSMRQACLSLKNTHHQHLVRRAFLKQRKDALSGYSTSRRDFNRVCHRELSTSINIHVDIRVNTHAHTHTHYRTHFNGHTHTHTNTLTHTHIHQLQCPQRHPHTRASSCSLTDLFPRQRDSSSVCYVTSHVHFR